MNLGLKAKQTNIIIAYWTWAEMPHATESTFECTIRQKAYISSFKWNMCKHWDNFIFNLITLKYVQTKRIKECNIAHTSREFYMQTQHLEECASNSETLACAWT